LTRAILGARPSGRQRRSRTFLRAQCWCKEKWAKESTFRDTSIVLRNCYRDFSIRRPWRIEKRRASCPPPDGSGWDAVGYRDEKSKMQVLKPKML
jgi:hypothetical protein